jgi:hypothetical protein
MSAPKRLAARWWLITTVGSTGLCGIAILGAVMAVTGAALTCTGGAATDTTSPGAGGGPTPTAAATTQIPPSRLALYRAAGQRFDIDWAFLASIGAQECDHGSCAGDNGSGCAGPMQIAMRPGSPCSPGASPTIFDTYGYDGNKDGRLDVNNPADAIFTAARLLREAKHAPGQNGTYAQYRQAACGYYGACADASAAYADDVMTRAVSYGFGGPGTPKTATSPGAIEQTGGCGAGPAMAGTPDGTGGLGPVHKVTSPRELKALPTSVTGGAVMQCDARIIPDVVWLARRFHVQVTACSSIHSQAGEHPLGAATDLVPEPGYTWPATTGALAHAIGWKRACAASGVAPDCARPPFRFAGYNGYPGHGDPAHCSPCGGGPHLHLSWLTSASPGQAQNAARSSYFAAAWIDTFTPTQGTP